jgi:hypothetical protein
MMMIVMYILCVLVWGFAQHGLVNAGLLIVPPGQSRLYLLGGAAILLGALALLGHTSADAEAAGTKGAATLGGVVMAALLVGLFLLAFR